MTNEPRHHRHSLAAIAKLWQQRVMHIWQYCSEGVWHDRRNNLGIRLLKTINLTVTSFLSAGLQRTACALTYRLLLALVPALALIFAIGRGFGFQNLLTSQLFSYFPSQQKALETGLKFVDSYLAQASEGIFVGVGIIVLLWTLISLLGAVEDAFNEIWGVKHGRTLWRKITDYTAIFLILPILMVCGSGLTVFMTSAIEDYLPFMTPLASILLDIASVVLIWLFFTGVYMLVPNARVKFKNALPAGILAGIAYQVLQALFVSGQLYVSKYNAIYGGFSFLPLLLIWLQLVWLFTLSGALLCYAAQSIDDYALESDVQGISPDYKRRISLAILSTIVSRYNNSQPPLSAGQIQRKLNIPLRLTTKILAEMEEMGLLCRIIPPRKTDSAAYQPARNLSALTVGEAINRLDHFGSNGFITHFRTDFEELNACLDRLEEQAVQQAPIPLTQLNQNNSKK